MFDHVVANPGVIQIGDENIAAARKEFARHCIPIIAEDVGGRKGRTVLFDLSDGSVRIQDAFGNEELY
jgi:chemotaxis protein CheD